MQRQPLQLELHLLVVGLEGSGLAVAECATGIGCAVGVPQAAISATLVTAGVAITASAVADMIELGLLFSNGEIGGGTESLEDDLEYTTQDLIDESVHAKDNIWRNPGTADDATDWFYRLADPGFSLANIQIFKNILRGSRVFNRWWKDLLSSNIEIWTTTLDLSKSPNLPNYVEIKISLSIG